MMMMMKRRGMGVSSKEDDDDQLFLPGFRFHPTDEELLSFYLQRKIEKKLTAVEIIKQIDIYKYDPWDLPRNSQTVTDKEWYFFCKRGRKYKNSVRPNRVTGSGFWKATGIDKQIYSVKGQGRSDCIGLKKTLVYYRGSAGKGTKTDWMMHEFRLPAANPKNTEVSNAKAADQEAEVWTVCRIFKRNVTNRRYKPDWREVAAVSLDKEKKYVVGSQYNIIDEENYVGRHVQGSSSINVQASEPDDQSCPPIILSEEAKEFFAHGNWDELVSVMEFPFDPSSVYNFKNSALGHSYCI